jgi:hypothetical protein
VAAVQKHLYDQAIGQLVKNATAAAEALVEIASNPKANDTARVSAASKILEICRDRIDIAQLEQRLALLENPYRGVSRVPR